MNKRKEKGIFRRKRLKKAEKGIYGILPELPGSTYDPTDYSRRGCKQRFQTF